MKKFKTIKSGITFFLDYDEMMELLEARKKRAFSDEEACIYIDGLDACDIWDFYDSAIMFTDSMNLPTTVIEDGGRII